MAVTTADEFLDVLEQSELLVPEQFEGARAAVEDGDDAGALAKRLVEARLLTNWQAAQIIAGRRSFYLGKYKLIGMLGRGGMGAVFLAEHVTMNRRVALKTISRKVSKEPKVIERFLDEARAVAALDHPNIVQAYSVDEEDERFYLVMEFVDGQNLEQVVRLAGPLEPGVAADYVRQAAEGLEHGHSRNMIHCGIKPSNLLLNRKGAIKIIGMGLAQLQDPGETRGKDQGKDQALDAVDFLAPEQAHGSKDFDRRADIYALGCTLYYLLTGRPPFPEGMLHEKLMKHRSMQPEGIGKLRSGVPEKLVKVCEKMMAKKPDERYPSAAEAAKALAEFPAPRRKAKPAAPLKKAEPLPAAAAAGAALPSVRAGQGQSSNGRRTTARKKSGLFDSPQKMIAAGVVATGLLVLLAILVPHMLSSSDSGENNRDPEDWLTVNNQKDGQSVPETGESPKPDKKPDTPLPAAVAAAVLGPLPVPVPNGMNVRYRIIPHGLRAGAMPYIDRPYTLTSVPSSLEDATYLQTTNDDKRSTGTALLSFAINTDATVYVGHDDRLKDRRPSWLSDFTETGEDLVGPGAELNLKLNLLKKDFPAGTVTLGGNNGTSGNCGMYLVVLVPRSGSELTVSYRDTVGAGKAIAAAKPSNDQDRAGEGAAEEPAADAAAPEGTPGTAPATSDAVASPALARKLIVARGLVSRFTFDEDAADSIGGHKGTFTGDATVDEDPDHGGVLQLDGDGDYVSLDDVVDLTGGEYSVGCWFKTSAKGDRTMVSMVKGSDQHAVLLELKDGTLRFLHRFPCGSGGGTNIYTGDTYCDGQWHHVLAVKDPVKMTLYVDGIAAGSADDSTRFDAPLKVRAGNVHGGHLKRHFAGQIDELRIYKRALTPEEVAKVAAPEPTPFDKLAETGNMKRFDKESEPAGAHLLGELILPPDTTVCLTLLGGDNAVRGSRKFSMEEVEGGKEWRTYLESKSRTGEPAKRVPIARILRKGPMLGFEWAKGVERETANSLLNCGLSISVDGESHFLPLARPQVVEPVVVDLDTGASRNNYTVESLPKRESLRLEIVRLEGGFRKSQRNPGSPLIPSGVCEITFKDKEEPLPRFWLRLGFDLRTGKVSVDVTANINYQLGQRPPGLFRAREAARIIKDVTAEQQRLLAQLARTKDRNQKSEINKKLKQIGNKIEKFSRLNDLYAKLKDKPGKVHFRIYMVIDEERQVTLMQSFPLKEPESGQKNPSETTVPE